MDNEILFSGFIDKDKKEHASIVIENLSNKTIFFSDYTPQMSYDSFSLKDKKEMLMVEWNINNASPEKFLKKFILDYKNQNIFWNIKKEKVQEIGTKDMNILNKIKNKGFFSVLAVKSDEMIFFQKDLSSGNSKIKTFFSNRNYAYIDLINYFSKEQKKAGFQVSVINKKIIKIKTRNIFDSKVISIKPSYITTQTLLGAPSETIPGNFFVMKIPKIGLYNFLAPFSHCIVYNHHQDPNFKINKLNIHHIEFLDAEDFFLCAMDAIFLNNKKDDFLLF